MIMKLCGPSLPALKHIDTPTAQGADGSAGPGAASPQPRGGGLLRPQPRAKPPGGRLVLRPSLGTGGAAYTILCIHSLTITIQHCNCHVNVISVPGPLPPRHRGHARHAQGGHQQETAGEGENIKLTLTNNILIKLRLLSCGQASAVWRRRCGPRWRPPCCSWTRTRWRRCSGSSPSR